MRSFYKDPDSVVVKTDKCDLDTATEVFKSRFKNADFITLPEFPVKPQIEFVLAKALQYKSVVMVLANQSVSYTGSSDACQRMVSVIDGLREKLSAIIQFGCPYAAREFDRIKRCVYSEPRQCAPMAGMVG